MGCETEEVGNAISTLATRCPLLRTLTLLVEGEIDWDMVSTHSAPHKDLVVNAFNLFCENYNSDDDDDDDDGDDLYHQYRDDAQYDELDEDEEEDEEDEQ